MNMQKIDLIKKLYRLDKAYFSLSDLEKVLDLDRESLRVRVSRLVGEGILERLRRGVYQLSLKPESLVRVANQLYYPSYLSFEYALGGYGIIDQKPYTITFATPRRTKRMMLRETEVRFHQLKSELFFGFENKNGVFWGEPEKVLLDQIYFTSLGKAEIDFESLTLTELSRERLSDYVKKYPQTVQKRVKELLPRLGQVSVGVK